MKTRRLRLDLLVLTSHNLSRTREEGPPAISYSFIFNFFQIDRLNFDIRPDGDDTEDMDDVDDVGATKGKHEMKVSNVMIVTQTSFENPPNKKSERIASRFLY